MPPSDAASQYPRSSGVAAMPTIGLLSGLPPIEPKNCEAPKANTPPSEGTIPEPGPVGGNHPVAGADRIDAHDGLVQRDAAERPEEPVDAEGEHATVGTHHAVAG